MKKIKYAGSFKRNYHECKQNIAEFSRMYREALETFKQETKAVQDHQLQKRELKHLRSFSVSPDIRVVYKETKSAYIFLRVGSHSKVYN